LQPIPRTGQRAGGPPLPGDPRTEAPPATDIGARRRPSALERAEFGDGTLAPEESRLRRGVCLRLTHRRLGAADPGTTGDREDPPASRPLAGLGQGRLPGVHYLGGARTDPSDDRGEPTENGGTADTEASDPEWRGLADGPGPLRAVRPRPARRV